MIVSGDIRSFRMKCFRRHVGGFTLIELLVVVSIIALLVSILLPALSKAKEQAKSVVCASQLRQFGLPIRYYAYDNSDFMPPNHLWSQYHPYLVRDIGSHFWNLGHLWNLGYVDVPRLYYCPSESSEGHKFNTVKNPWLEAFPGSQSSITRMSYYYYTRVPAPVFWSDATYSDWKARGRAGGYYNYYVKISDKIVLNKVILSDNIYFSHGYPHAERKGFNVLGSDGGVNFWRDSIGYFDSISTTDLSASQVYEVFDMFDTSRF